MSYIGQQPQATFATKPVQRYTAGVDFTAGTTTQLTTSSAIGSANNICITFNGLVQHHDQYSVGGSTVTFTSAIPVGCTSVEISWNNESTIITPADGSVTTAKLASPLILTSPRETRTAPTISAGVLTLDLAAASVFDVSLNAAITSIVLSGVASSGTAHSFVLTFTADGTVRAVAWPVAIKWPSGTPPTLTSTNSKKDCFVFMTTDGGTSYHGFVAGQNL